MNYKEDLKINKFALDDEWLQQPSHFAFYSEQGVEAEDERDRASEQLTLIEAQIGSNIRKDPKAFGFGDKVTEGAIKEVIILNAERIAASNVYLDAVKKAKILSIAKIAFDHRKRALEKLTDLFLQNYWSRPADNSKATSMSEEAAEHQHREALALSPRLLRRKNK